MSIPLILLLVAAGALIFPSMGGDEDDEGPTASASANGTSGGPSDDLVNGTDGNDLIQTFLGNDEIYGNGGNDDIRAGDGEDYVEGGAGLDYIRGGAGNDIIFGNEGNDRIISDRGDDYVDAGIGSDIVRGGEGNDTLLGGLNTVLDESGLPTGNFGATDQISGEDGDDLMIAWGGQSVLNGGLNDADAPSNLTNNDTLVAATGEVIMENRTGDNIDIALATLEDDQISQATVVDFNRDDDTLVLTVDHTSTVDMPVGYTPTFTVAYEAGVSETQGAGTFVTVTWDNPYGTTAETQSESATAFLVGYSPTDLDGNLNLDIYLTEDASYADPIATLDGLGLLDPNAVTLQTPAIG